MSLDEARWPGPDEHQGLIDLDNVAHSYTRHMIVVTFRYGKTLEQLAKTAEEVERVEAFLGRDDIVVSDPIPPMCSHKPSAPSHGPRRGPAFRKGKKQY